MLMCWQKCASKKGVGTLLFVNAIAFGSLVFRGIIGSKISTVNEYTLSVHDRWAHLSKIMDTVK